MGPGLGREALFAPPSPPPLPSGLTNTQEVEEFGRRGFASVRQELSEVTNLQDVGGRSPTPVAATQEDAQHFLPGTCLSLPETRLLPKGSHFLLLKSPIM